MRDGSSSSYIINRRRDKRQVWCCSVLPLLIVNIESVNRQYTVVGTYIWFVEWPKKILSNQGIAIIKELLPNKLLHTPDPHTIPMIHTPVASSLVVVDIQ